MGRCEMTGGIIIFGANGSGKSTLGRELASVLDFKYMDIETYHFEASGIPYTVERSREDCVRLMLADIKKHQNFVLSAVTGDFGQELSDMYNLAILISVPLEIRLKRKQQREYMMYRERILEGGDLYDQHIKFIDFIATRSLSKIEQWAGTLKCPLIQIYGLREISDNTNFILDHYRHAISNK